MPQPSIRHVTAHLWMTNWRLRKLSTGTNGFGSVRQHIIMVDARCESFDDQ